MATILIVDDEPVILDVFRRFLSADGRALVLAGSAREAILRGEEAEELDVALIDKNLGDGSGLDVARALKRVKPDVEVILVTGYASLDTAIEAVQIGAFDYVTKPISDYEALNLKVENAVEKVRMKRRERELEQNLRQAQKMEAVGRLAGGIAHDFSNLLAVILGYSDLLLRDLPAADARVREWAEGIVEAAHRAVGVTRQLLTLSRKKLLRPEVLTLNRVVGDLGKLLARAIGERIELSTDLQEGVWPAIVDPDQLAQVLLNLAVNARDAMPDGGPLSIATSNVELTTSVQDLGLPAGRYVTLSVKDGGCGMSEDVRARIFEPFFTTKETGTGLGLATVHGIVREAGGAIRVESRPRGGSTFTVFLPAAGERDAHISLPVSASAPRGLGETVVIAEDDDALRVLLGRVLSGSGYRVVAARNGSEALEAVRASGGRVDLLLTDVVMPRMTGTELAQEIAGDQPWVKVLFMTGHTDDATLLGRYRCGDADVIQKPFTSEALLTHLRQLLGPSRATA